MKLLSLNIWGGKVYPELAKLIKKHKSIDIFCLQEVYHNGIVLRPHTKDMRMDIFNDIQRILKNHQGFFSPTEDREEGLAIFIKKNILIAKLEEHFVYRWKNSVENFDASTRGRLIQVVQFVFDNNNYSVVNFHGLWNGLGKVDSPERIKQSKMIRNHIEKYMGKVILCGDFNLLPSTQSIKILQENMINLIEEFNVTSTRSGLYKKPERFADYILVSKDIKIKTFRVFSDEVSDHLPLYLEFE
ncbi:MAG: endonuclease/exonuclease/phosphatase family protein [Candidatus Levybacteria bacterium]|nr:endonuclease/exonuclease/phosphatase family protein [Candidatus Levybacteria bacterium]